MEVRPARDAREVEDALALRRRVFSGEQGVDPAADLDGRDGEAMQFVAVDGGRVVGTCRVLVRDGVASLGRMAVERDARGGGVGARLLDVAERAARGAGAELVRLHAQVAATSFYERGGYLPVGEPFVEEGIDHVTMERALA
ncbi:MAG TPA: GNAT family N-acetyltransferase [Thermoleophilaceae bacterium]